MESKSSNQVIGHRETRTFDNQVALLPEYHDSDLVMSPQPAKQESRYQIYRTSPEITAKIRPYFKRDNWRGIFQVLGDWGIVVLAIISSVWAWENLSTIVAVPIYAIAIAVIGAKQRGLKVNSHQATHKTLAKNKHLNYFLGTVLSSWAVLESFSSYNDSHNSPSNGHHPNIGTNRDVNYMALVRQGLYEEGCTRENLRRYLWSIPLKTPGYAIFLFQHRIWNSREDKQERIFRLLFLLIVTAGILYAGWAHLLLTYWLVPLLTFSMWIGIFIQVSEHYPLAGMDYKIDIYASRNRLLNGFWNFFVATHQEGYHQLHHMFPGLPFWHSKAVHKILMETDELYASLNQETGMGTLIQQMTPQATTDLSIGLTH